MSSIDAPGEEFERDVANALRLIPGVAVRRHVTLTGKVVDIVAEIRERLSGQARTVAVECKDYSRRLSRETTAGIIADYQPLITSSEVSELYIVTRNGIVGNAAAMVDKTPGVLHLTYTDLLTRVMDVHPLVSSMRDQFYEEPISEYYEQPKCLAFDYNLAASGIDKYYNPFIDYWINKSSHTWDRYSIARSAWSEWCQSFGQDSLVTLSDGYSQSLFEKIVNDRNRYELTSLQDMLDTWLADEANHVGMAVLGSYGTGKSTFARNYAAKSAAAYLAGRSSRIPLLIELRHFTSDQDIGSLITHELADKHGIDGANFARFQALNRAGLILLILDGFDEMKHGMSREALAHNFNEINSLMTRRAKILLCGRPTIFADEIEQRVFLQLAIDSPLENEARYLPVTIQPIDAERIMPLILAYTKAHRLMSKPAVRERLSELARELDENKELQQLLSRPVHVPMLLRILPSLHKDDIAGLRRSVLYLKFIEQTISRESRKRASATSALDGTQRLDFAARLACEMLIAGDGRSISASAIPQDLILRYKTGKRSIEAVKRDLIAACFLEVKNPDILFFGHKSYCEFLVAFHLRAILREGGGTATLSRIVTPEIASFFLELCDSTDLRSAVIGLAENEKLVFRLLKHRPQTKLDQEKHAELARLVLTAEGSQYYLQRGTATPTSLAYAYVNLCSDEAVRIDNLDQAISVLWLLANHPEDYVAINAIRALPAQMRPTPAQLTTLIGSDRLSRWQRKGWVDERLERA